MEGFFDEADVVAETMASTTTQGVFAETSILSTEPGLVEKGA